MKAGLIIFSFLISMVAFGSGKTPPSSDGRGTPQCRAYDGGSTEEHAPHYSCDDCLSAHSNCEMRCFSYDYTCRAEGSIERLVEVVDPVTKRVVLERRIERQTFSETSHTEYQARERALRECYFSGAMNCSMSTCNENSSISSRQSCRR